MIVGVIVGIIALGAGVVGLFAGTTPYLVLMSAAIALLWLITVTHRLLAGSSARIV